jgi:serine/threonine protein kinase
MTKTTTKVKVTKRKINDYLLNETIAESVDGMVYLATRMSDDAAVVLKCIKPDFQGGINFIKKEASILKRLSHTHIITLLDHFYDNELSDVLVLPFIKYGSLFDRFNSNTENNFYELEWVLQTIIEVSLAVSFAHSSSVIHGDINPSNVYVTDQNKVLLGDWASAHTITVKNKKYRRKVSLLVQSEMCRSPSSQNMLALSKYDDIFAVGLLFQYLLTGMYPHVDPENHGFNYVLPRHMHFKPVGNEMVDIIVKALHVDEQHRYDSIDTMIYDLIRIKKILKKKLNKNLSTRFSDRINIHDMKRNETMNLRFVSPCDKNGFVAFVGKDHLSIDVILKLEWVVKSDTLDVTITDLNNNGTRLLVSHLDALYITYHDNEIVVGNFITKKIVYKMSTVLCLTTVMVQPSHHQCEICFSD